MTFDINNVSNWVQVIWFGSVSLGTIYGGFKMWFAFKGKLDNLENYTYKRNGGGSIADSQARMEMMLQRQDQAIAENTKLTIKTVEALAELKGRFNNHLEEGTK